MEFPETLTDGELVLRAKEWMLAGGTVIGCARASEGAISPWVFHGEYVGYYVMVDFHNDPSGTLVATGEWMVAQYHRVSSGWERSSRYGDT